MQFKVALIRMLALATPEEKKVLLQLIERAFGEKDSPSRTGVK